tara:strand:- start:12 stop:161 length:150 start_codon:yes stop_codon:yes gene_type:complete
MLIPDGNLTINIVNLIVVKNNLTKNPASGLGFPKAVKYIISAESFSLSI